MGSFHMTTSALALNTAAAPVKPDVAHALHVVSLFPMWKLRGAKVWAHQVPDTSNPPGYYHRSVSLTYTTYFGIKITTRIFHQRCASDEFEQDEVLLRVGSLITSINSML